MLFVPSLNKLQRLIRHHFVPSSSRTKNLIATFLGVFTGICPNATTSVCSNLTNTNATSIQDFGCDFEKVPYGQDLEELLTLYMLFLKDVEEEVGDLESDLLETQSILQKAETYYPEIGKAVFWSAAGCSLALGAISMILAGAMIYLESTKENGRERALPKSFAFTRSYLMIPLVFLLVVINWILSMSFIFIGIGSSDLCYNTPDQPMLNFLEKHKEKFDSLVYSLARYYISGCPKEQAPQGLETAIKSIQETLIPALAALSDTIEGQGVESLQEECGTGIAAASSIITSFGNQLCVFGLTMVSTKKHPIFHCMGSIPRTAVLSIFPAHIFCC